MIWGEAGGNPALSRSGKFLNLKKKSDPLNL